VCITPEYITETLTDGLALVTCIQMQAESVNRIIFIVAFQKNYIKNVPAIISSSNIYPKCYEIARKLMTNYTKQFVTF